jgi:hypothetical protein
MESVATVSEERCTVCCEVHVYFCQLMRCCCGTLTSSYLVFVYVASEAHDGF